VPFLPQPLASRWGETVFSHFSTLGAGTAALHVPPPRSFQEDAPLRLRKGRLRSINKKIYFQHRAEPWPASALGPDSPTRALFLFLRCLKDRDGQKAPENCQGFDPVVGFKTSSSARHVLEHAPSSVVPTLSKLFFLKFIPETVWCFFCPSSGFPRALARVTLAFFQV